MFRSPLSTAFIQFKNCLLSDLNIIYIVHDLFINVELHYAKKLEASINHLKRKKNLKPEGRKFYNCSFYFRYSPRHSDNWHGIHYKIQYYLR